MAVQLLQLDAETDAHRHNTQELLKKVTFFHLVYASPQYTLLEKVYSLFLIWSRFLTMHLTRRADGGVTGRRGRPCGTAGLGKVVVVFVC